MAKPTILEVPYSEEDQAKSLGAKWNPKMKKWYIPLGRDIEPFRKWIPKEHSENEIKARPPIYLIESSKGCWKCNIRSLSLPWHHRAFSMIRNL